MKKRRNTYIERIGEMKYLFIYILYDFIAENTRTTPVAKIVSTYMETHATNVSLCMSLRIILRKNEQNNSLLAKAASNARTKHIAQLILQKNDTPTDRQ